MDRETPSSRAPAGGLLAAALALAAGGAAPGQRQPVEFPLPVDLNVQMMEVREAAQRQSLWRFQVEHDFEFTNQRQQSGITFENRVVEDAGKEYKAVHYDHGNGVAVADVDGDGRYDLYFTTQLGRNELWINQGGGRFRNATDGSPLGLEEKISVTASFGDVDGDGDPDLYVTTVREGNHLFQNDGRGNFTDVTAAAGLEHAAHSSGAVFFDYDLDGDLDLFLVNVGRYTTDRTGPGDYWIGYPDAFSGHLYPDRTERSVLYRNLGDGRFEDVSEATGLVDGSWSGDATFTDFNGDGYPDLYVLNMQGDDHYWENQGGSRFVERCADLFPKTPWGTMGVKFFDWDNDGLFDLLLTDMHSDMSREVTPGFEKFKSVITWGEDYLDGGDNNIYGNAFFHNRGDGRFVEMSDRVGAENYWPWGLSVGDLNADGWEDVFITSSMNFPYRYGVNTLLLNNRGQTFLDAEFILGVEPRPDGRYKRPWFDLDCDAADRAHRLCAGRTGQYTILGSVGTRASAIFDLDDDGDLDIVTNEFNDPPMVLISDLAQRRKIAYLKVRLIGGASNRDGLGALVKVRAGGREYVKYQDGTSGYLSHSLLPLYFGLGDARQVDSVEVRWPSGRAQTVSEGIRLDSLLEIEEP